MRLEDDPGTRTFCHTLSCTKRSLDPPSSKAYSIRPYKSKAAGTALDWATLMKLAEKHAVRFLHVMTCTNAAEPFGMGLWEGGTMSGTTIAANVKPVNGVFGDGDDAESPFGTPAEYCLPIVAQTSYQLVG